MQTLIHLAFWTILTINPTPVAPKKNIVTITIDSYDGDLDGLVSDFTDELMQVLTDSGIDDVSIRVVDISYTPDDG